MDFSNQTKTTEKNAPTEKSQDFCLTFMNSMEDGLLKFGKIQGVDPPLLPTVNTNSGILDFTCLFD
jgi:hypothetical protein